MPGIIIICIPSPHTRRRSASASRCMIDSVKGTAYKLHKTNYIHNLITTNS